MQTAIIIIVALVSVWWLLSSWYVPTLVFGNMLSTAELDKKMQNVKLYHHQEYDMLLLVIDNDLHFASRNLGHWSNPFTKWHIYGDKVKGCVPRWSSWSKKLDVMYKMAHK